MINSAITARGTSTTITAGGATPGSTRGARAATVAAGSSPGTTARGRERDA